MRFRQLDLTAVVLGVLLAAVSPADAGEDDGGEDDGRAEALAIYAERCGVEPGSPRERYASSDWDALISTGREPARILEIAAAIPEPCTYVSFRSAILATELELLRPPPPPPEQEDRTTDFVRSAGPFSEIRGQALRSYRNRCRTQARIASSPSTRR